MQIPLDITNTRFISLELLAGMLSGIPIGQGKCKGVSLSANHFQLYTANTAQGAGTGLKFYYGDRYQQSKEYLINTNTTAGNTNNRDSGFIPCEDLSEIYVRFTDASPAKLQIEIEVYGAEGEISATVMR